MGLSQRDQTKHNTLLRLGTQSVIIKTKILNIGITVFRNFFCEAFPFRRYSSASVTVTVIKNFMQPFS